VPGGYLNIASGQYSFAAGQNAQAINDGSFVWADFSSSTPFTSTASNQFLIRASGGVGIGTASPLAALDVRGNQTIVGNLNINDGRGATNFTDLTIGPGFYIGGEQHSINFDDGAGHIGSLIVGYNGIGQGYFKVGNLYNSGHFTDTTALFVLGNGNVGIGTTNPFSLLVVGSSASPAYCNGTTWVNGSDRNIKDAFAPINPLTILEKVSALPIAEWKYKVESDGTRHLGPVAQDFHAAFGLNGEDDKHIATVDEGGVALAAIQGLNEKVESRSQKAETSIQELKAENAELKARLEKLEQLLQFRNGGGR